MVLSPDVVIIECTAHHYYLYTFPFGLNSDFTSVYCCQGVKVVCDTCVLLHIEQHFIFCIQNLFRIFLFISN